MVKPGFTPMGNSLNRAQVAQVQHLGTEAVNVEILDLAAGLKSPRCSRSVDRASSFFHHVLIEMLKSWSWKLNFAGHLAQHFAGADSEWQSAPLIQHQHHAGCFMLSLTFLA